MCGTLVYDGCCGLLAPNELSILNSTVLYCSSFFFLFLFFFFSFTFYFFFLLCLLFFAFPCAQSVRVSMLRQEKLQINIILGIPTKTKKKVHKGYSLGAKREGCYALWANRF